MGSVLLKRSGFVILVLALGGLIGLELGTFFAATTIFSGVEAGHFGSTVAGELAGDVFQKVNLIGFFLLPVVSLLLSLMIRGERFSAAAWYGFVLLQVSFALLLVETAFVSPGISALRESLGGEYGSVANAPGDDPDRQRFAFLHGMSMLRGLAQLCSTALALVVLVFTWRAED